MPKTERKTKAQPSEVVIHDSDILLYTTMLAQVQQAEEQLKRIKEQAAATEAALVLMLRQKHTFDGVLSARLDVSEEPGKFSPKYKEEYVEHMKQEHGLSDEAIDAKLREKYPVKTKKVETLVVIGPERE